MMQNSPRVVRRREPRKSSCPDGLTQLGGVSFGGGMGKSRPLLERFWEKVDRHGPDECWPWLGARHGYGHGHIRVDGDVAKAHRVSYTINVGPIPDGLFVCHTCDNPPCVNPSHLWLGTHADNMADMVAKGRGALGVKHGELSPLAKLTERDVRDIRQSALPGAAVAESYGVSEGAISSVRRGKSWSHLPIPVGVRKGVAIGERHGMSKLTAAAVLAIRASSAPGDVLAHRYDVKRNTIYGIRAGRTWRHLL